MGINLWKNLAEPVLEEDNNNNNIRGEEKLDDEIDEGELSLDGGFSVPDSNAFGHSFR